MKNIFTLRTNRFASFMAGMTIFAQLVLVGNALPLAAYAQAADTTTTDTTQSVVDLYSAPVDTTTTDTTVTETTPTEEVAPADTTVTEPVVEETVATDTTSSETTSTPVVESSPVSTPTLSTDKEDYHPGDTASIFGSLFGSLQNIVLKIFGSDKHDNNYTEQIQNITTDSAGSFTTSYTLDNLYRPFYEVVATDVNGTELARTMFRDAAIGTYDQCSNDLGDGYGPADIGCHWINGNLNSNNSLYKEGDSTVQRLWLDGLTPGTNHSVTFTYGTTKAGKHAYDFLTTWDGSENWVTVADRCQDIDGCDTASDATFAIPTDANAGGRDTGYGSRLMTIRGGTITGISGPTIVSGTYAGDSETAITVNYTVGPSNGSMCATKGNVTSCGIALWFGAHIAKGNGTGGWGAGTGASSISGSPYHVALSAMDGGSIGNRDNQMQSGTIVSPSTITIHKVTSPNASDSTVFNFTATGTGYNNFTLTGGNQNQQNITATGSFSVTETVSAGWANTGLTCTASGTGSSATPNLAGHSVAITIGAGGGAAIDCIYTNTLQQGHLIVQKTTVPAADTTVFSINTSGTGTITGGGAGTITDALDKDYTVAPGTYSVTETVPSGWDKTGDTCQNVTVAAGETKTCVITNTKRGHLIVDKVTVPGGDTTVFSIAASGSGTITGGGAGTVTDATNKDYEVTPGTYSVAETVPSGWDKTGDTCQNVSVAAGETKTCTITNTKRGTIIVEKQTNPDGASGTFTFTGDAAGTISDNGQIVVSNLVPGTYTSTEAAKAGWDLTSISCNDSNSTGNVGTGVATFNLAAGETVKCTFTNTQRGSIKVVKNTTGGDSTFTFNSNFGVSSLTTSGGTTNQTVTNLLPGTGYSISEDALTGWVNTNAFCDHGTIGAVEVLPGQLTTCTFANSKPDLKVEISPLNATNEVGSEHVFTVTVTQYPNGATPASTVNVTPSVTPAPGTYSTTCGAAVAFSGNVATCTITINNNTPAIFTANAAALATIGGVSIGRMTGDGLSGDSGAATKKYVDANISISPLTATNEVGNAHTFTGHVNVNDGSGWANAPAGTVINFSIVSGPGTLSAPSCVTVGSTGSCTVDLNSLVTGMTTLNAATDVTVGGLSLHRETGDSHLNDSADAVKTWVNLRITIDSNSVNEVNNAHTFTVTVEKDLGNGAGFVPVVGATVTPGITGAGSLTGTGSCQTGTTDASGHCTIIVNSSTAGVGTISATTTVVVGGVSMTRSLGDTLSGDSAKATKTWVDAKISIGSDGVNEINHPHTFTGHVDVNNGSGWVSAPNGTVINFAIGTGPGTLSAPSCVTAGGTGSCTVDLNSLVTGVTTVNASANVTVGGLSLSRTTNGAAGNSGPATKTWVDLQILIDSNSTNAVNNAHTFTVTVNKDLGTGTFVPMAGATVTSGISGLVGATVTGGTCTTTVTNASGQCTIIVNSPNTGVGTVDASVTASVGGSAPITRSLGDSVSGDSAKATKTWVNAKISIAPQTSTNEVNDDHTFVVTVEQDLGDGNGFVPVAAGTLANAIVSPATTLDVSDCNDGVDALGKCNVIVNSAAAGVYTITARATVVIGGVTFKLQTNGVGANSGPATKTYVDAKIVLSPLTATNNIGDAHTFTATVSQNDGSGWSAAPDGTLVTFTLLNNTANADFIPTSGSNTCTTTAGVCSVQINTLTPGSVDAHGVTTFTVGGVSLTRATDGTHGSSVDAHKDYVAGALDLTKTVVTTGYPSAGLSNVDGTFTFHVVGPSYPSGHDETFTMVDGVITSTNPVHLSPLIPGDYTVTETGVDTVAWTVTGSGGVTTVAANQTATKTITNTIKVPHTTISITPNTYETQPGENVILTIVDTNDGQVPLSNPSVVLTFGATTVTLDKTHYYVSGDTNNDGIMDVGEAWTWSYQTLIGADTTFTVDGHGDDSFGTDVTPSNGISSEHGSIVVKVIGTTRTLGYWQTHTDFTSAIFNSYLSPNNNYVGEKVAVVNGVTHKGILTSPAQVFAGFYAPIAKTSTGSKRTPVEQARVTLLQQLLAAKLNCAAFGCSTATQTNIANADLAYKSGNKNDIMSYVTILDNFNNSGDANAIPAGLPATGKASPAASKVQAASAGNFWDTP